MIYFYRSAVELKYFIWSLRKPNSLTIFPQALTEQEQRATRNFSHIQDYILHPKIFRTMLDFSYCFKIKHLFLAALPASAYNTYPAKNHAKLRHREYCSITCSVCQPSSYTMKAFLSTQQTKQLLSSPV